MSGSPADQTDDHPCCLEGLGRITWPDPWPNNDADVKRWRITAPYEFFEREPLLSKGFLFIILTR